jgi:hypothetical protein
VSYGTRTRSRLLRLASVIALLVGVEMLAACAPGDDPGGAAPAPPIQTEQWRSDVDAFLQECERGIGTWQAAQVDYPGVLQVQLGEPAAYVATLDIRTAPDAPSKEIPGPSPESEPVFVQCVVAARLVPMGDGLTVDTTGWVPRTFTPSGVVDWAWGVTAIEARDQQLRLELHPAVQSPLGLEVDADATPTTTFITDVQTQAPAVQKVRQYLEDNWPAVVTISGIVAAAVFGVIRFGGDVGKELREAVGKWRGADGEPKAPPAPRRKKRRRSAPPDE